VFCFFSRILLRSLDLLITLHYPPHTSFLSTSLTSHTLAFSSSLSLSSQLLLQALSLTTPSPSSVCLISIVRFKSLYEISVSTDVSWDNVPIADWTAVECNIGIMCACLPTLKPLLSRFLPVLMHSNSNNHSDPTHPNHGSYPGFPHNGMRINRVLSTSNILARLKGGIRPLMQS
jgi:hypothetical protein